MMGWYFVLSDDKLLVYVGKEVARDPKTKKSFGKVRDIKLGRARDEVVLKFADTRDGLHLSTKLFMADANDFCRSVSNKKTTKEFVTSVMDTSGLTSKQTEEVRLKRKTPRMPTVMLDGERVHKKQEIKPLGTKDVRLDYILDVEKSLSLRDLNMEWVNHLKNEIIKDPTVVTTVPLLLKGDKVSSIDHIEEDAKFYPLGGCHLVKAIKSAETFISINAHIYTGLTNEEALKVASMHNMKMEHLPLSFQDKVNLGRRLLTQNGSENLQGRLADILTAVLGMKINGNSLSTIISVCKYGDEQFTLFRKIVAASEQRGEKSVNAKLFKLMHGCTEDVRREGLVRAAGCYTNAVNWLEEEKMKSQLRTIFVTQTGCSSWGEAEDAYPEYAENLEKFKDKKINGKLIPQHIVDYCVAAKEYRDIQLTAANISVQISVKIGGKEIKNDELNQILEIHRKQIVSQIQKKSSNICFEE